MQDVAGHALAVLKAHRAWAGPALGLGACFEALVVIGAFTPLTPLLVLVGAGIGAGVFSPSVLVWTMGGCGLGNWISYEARGSAPGGRRHVRRGFLNRRA